ncbi:transcriptional regulator [Salmonella enterica subsp. salamae]|nr:transcriptional regulator [Salmonella enterica subsp. salamae]
MTKRDIFSELMTGMQELKEHQEGKITLKTYKVSKRAPITTGETTYQNWELGRAKPNAQTVLLIRMVQKNPETLNALAQL